MSTASKYIRSSAAYFIGNVMAKVISFFLLPLYTHYFAPEDLGYYDLAVKYMNIIIPIVSIEIWVGIMRFVYDRSDSFGKYKVIFNGFVITAAGLAVYTAGMIAAGLIWDIKCAFYIYLYGVMLLLQSDCAYIIRSLGHTKTFVISGIAGTLVNVLSNVVMVIAFGMRLDSLFISMIISFAVQIAIIESKAKILRNISLKMLDSALIKSLIRFSLPLCFNSVSFWFLSSYNSIGVSNILGLAANGIYSAAGKVSLVVGVASSCFTTAWQELVYSKGSEDTPKGPLYSKSLTYQLAFIILMVALILPAMKILCPYFIGENYAEAFGLIPYYLIATASSVYANFLSYIFSGEKKTKTVFYTTVAAAAVNLVMLHTLVPKFGINMASVSMFCGFAVAIIIRYAILYKTHGVRINFVSQLFPAMAIILSYIAYFRGGIIVNLLTGIFAAAAALFTFRNILKNIISEARGKFIKKT